MPKPKCINSTVDMVYWEKNQLFSHPITFFYKQSRYKAEARYQSAMITDCNHVDNHIEIECQGRITCYMTTNRKDCDLSHKSSFICTIEQGFPYEALFDKFISYLQICRQLHLPVLAKYDLEATLILDGQTITTLTWKTSENLTDQDPSLSQYTTNIQDFYKQVIENELQPTKIKDVYTMRYCPTYFSNALKDFNAQTEELKQKLKNYFIHSEQEQVARLISRLEQVIAALINPHQNDAEPLQMAQAFINALPEDLGNEIVAQFKSMFRNLDSVKKKYAQEIGFLDANGNTHPEHIPGL